MTDLPITTLSSLQIGASTKDDPNLVQNAFGTQGGFYLGQLTSQQIANLAQIRNGTIVYNLTTNLINIFQNGIWSSFSDLNVVNLPPINIIN